MDKLNELLSGLQAGVHKIGPVTGAKIAAQFHTLLGEQNRPEWEPLRRELATLQVLLEGSAGIVLNAEAIGRQLIVVGRSVKSVVPPSDPPGLASTLDYLAATLEQQGRSLVNDLEVAVAPDARFARAESNVVGTASADQTEPGNVYASVRGL